MGTQAFFNPTTAGRGRPLNLVGEHITVPASGATTGSCEADAAAFAALTAGFTAQIAGLNGTEAEPPVDVR